MKMCVKKLPKAIWPWVAIKKTYNKLTKSLYYSKTTL